MATMSLGVIGDFGAYNDNSVQVSRLVNSWGCEAIVTTGDNLYSCPPLEKHYQKIVGPLYKGYMESKSMKKIKKPTVLIKGQNSSKKPTKCLSSTKFLPCVGNHDYPFEGYCNYFSLPTYYSAEFNPSSHASNSLVKLVSLNNYQDIDGRFDVTHKMTVQREWLEKELDSSLHFKWIIASFHYPQQCSSYSNGENDHNLKRLFPFHKWANVALILSGHHHIYERLVINGITNVVVGTSGHSVRRKAAEEDRVEGSICMDDSGYGALKLSLNENCIQGSYHVLCPPNEGRKTVSPEDLLGSVIKDEFLIEK